MRIRRILRLIFLVIAFTGQMNLYARDKIKDTTSIIVPCCARHAQHLVGLLKMYEQQTVLPDEIVVSLSECNQVDDAIVNEIKTYAWKFPVILLLFEEKKYAGENRNAACEVASGDILLCQDVDDIPHPQRIELVKYFFRKHDILHLAHLFSDLKPGEKEVFKKYRFSAVPWFYPPNMNAAYKARITNGNVCIRRELFEQIKWTDMPRAQDTKFNDDVYKYTTKRIVIKVSLLGYRRYLSSSKK